MYSRDIKKCHPELQRIWPLHQTACAVIGIRIELSRTSSEWDEQRALYAQGRETLEMVNHLRDHAGLPAIIEDQNKIATWTTDSKHLRHPAEAYDIFIVDGKTAVWNLKADTNGDNKADYKQVAEIGRSLGLVAGYFWDKQDAPHFELKGV
jgi:hypothetical protein